MWGVEGVGWVGCCIEYLCIGYCCICHVCLSPFLGIRCCLVGGEAVGFWWILKKLDSSKRLHPRGVASLRVLSDAPFLYDVYGLLCEGDCGVIPRSSIACNVWGMRVMSGLIRGQSVRDVDF